MYIDYDRMMLQALSDALNLLDNRATRPSPSSGRTRPDMAKKGLHCADNPPTGKVIPFLRRV